MLATVSTTDPLTETRNRFSLRRDFDRYLAMNVPLLVMMLDVDDFKSINDSFGHVAGDRALCAVGHELMGQFGSEHVYRYGGDEFVVVIPDVLDKASLEARVARLREQLGRLRIEGADLPIRFSGGYVHGLPDNTEGLRLMFGQADEWLYRSKRAGKNCLQGARFELFRHGGREAA